MRKVIYPRLGIVVFSVVMLWLGGCVTHRANSRASGTASLSSPCELGQALVEIEALPMEQRLLPSLRALASHCAGGLGELAQAADQAQASGDRAQRAALLAEAASLALPSGCSTNQALEPATALLWPCPPPEELHLAEALLKDLDAGSYLFVLAARARLNAQQQLDADSERLLQIILLSAAIEGETAKGAVPSTQETHEDSRTQPKG